MRLLARFLIVFVLILLPFLATAQHFEWVERYTGGESTGNDETNEIKQTVLDSEGNIYFFGECAVSAGFHGNKFLPITPSGSNWNTPCSVTGKMSPEGELLWSKVIWANDANHGGGEIQIVGDTVLFIKSSLNVGYSFIKNLYYLDTLFRLGYIENQHQVDADYVVYRDDTLLDFKKFSYGPPTPLFLMMDFDGNIIENYTLTMAFLDSNGSPFKYFAGQPDNDKVAYVLGVSYPSIGTSYTMDKDGNIIVLNGIYGTIRTGDTTNIDARSPEVRGLRFYVNNSRYFDMPLPDARPSGMRHNCQILKFSPHFEELLASQFVFEPTLEHLDTVGYLTLSDLKCDDDGNLYLNGVVSNNLWLMDEENDLYIGGSDSLNIHFSSSSDDMKGFVVKYDTALNPIYLKQYIMHSDTASTDNYGNWFNTFQFDGKGNMVILGGLVYNDTVNTSCYFDSTRIEGTGMIFLYVRMEDGKLMSYKVGPSAGNFANVGGFSFPSLAIADDRLITQIVYRDYLNFAGREFRMPHPYEYGMGFAVWDYDGNELYYVDYGVNGNPYNTPSSVCLHDSILYLTGMLASGGARFGKINVPNAGMSQSFIAKYVDTAFMHPYTGGGNQDIQLLVRDGEPLMTVYPNPCTQRVTVSYDGAEPLQGAILTDLSGRQHTVTLSAAGEGRYTVDFSALPSANYLLTLVTSSGQRITSRLLKR